MEPVTIGIICALAFGSIVALSAFIRQLLLSRDKSLNDQVQQKALAEEMKELKEIRSQIEGTERFNSHYKVLGDNKDAIIYLDDKIEDILQKKFELIKRYGDVTFKESSLMISHGIAEDKKEVCDHLKRELDKSIRAYNEELLQLQERRARLWDSNAQLQDHLIDQEKKRNQQLDYIYQKHTGILEKVFLRQAEDNRQVMHEHVQSGGQAFKMILLAPFQFLAKLFGLSKGLSLEQFTKEVEKREEISEIEEDINGSDYDADKDERYESDFEEENSEENAVEEDEALKKVVDFC